MQQPDIAEQICDVLVGYRGSRVSVTLAGRCVADLCRLCQSRHEDRERRERVRNATAKRQRRRAVPDAMARLMEIGLPIRYATKRSGLGRHF